MRARKDNLRLGLSLGFLLPLVLWGAVYANAAYEKGLVKFAVIGDMPYRTEDIAGYEKLIDQINQEKLDWVVFVGDTKNGSTSCANEAYTPIMRWFARYTAPLIYTPGDNEWTDCHRITAGRFDPNERLKWLRNEFFQKPHPWAKSLKTTAQRPPLIENQYWFREGVMFATLHVVGSQNHFSEDHSPHSEWAVRNGNNLNWLKWIFFEAKNKQSPMIFLFWHGDPLFEASAKERPGYRTLLEELEKNVREFPGDVVLIHGDRHRFVIDNPLPLNNFTRVITFGDRDLFALLLQLNKTQGTLDIFSLGDQQKQKRKTILFPTGKTAARTLKKGASHAF